MTVKFIVGTVYACRSFGDYDCIFTFKVVRRTAKSVWLTDPDDRAGPTRRKLRVADGVEKCDPHGRHSMSPILSADRTEDDVRASDRRTVVTPPPRLRPYQQQVTDAMNAILSVNRPTARTVEALKASCEPVAAAVVEHQHARQFDRATAFLTGFLPQHAGTVHRDTVRDVLDMLAEMTADDFAELDRIRHYLRGE